MRSTLLGLMVRISPSIYLIAFTINPEYSFIPMHPFARQRKMLSLLFCANPPTGTVAVSIFLHERLDQIMETLLIKVIVCFTAKIGLSHRGNDQVVQLLLQLPPSIKCVDQPVVIHFIQLVSKESNMIMDLSECGSQIAIFMMCQQPGTQIVRHKTQKWFKSEYQCIFR